MPNQKAKYKIAHRKNIMNESALSKGKINAGNIVTFTYGGKQVTNKKPLVLVVHPKFRNHLHGVNIDYLSGQELKQLWKTTNLEQSGEVEELMKKNLPLVQVNISNPRAFYNSKLKKFLKSKSINAYRTYAVGSIGGLKLIDYNFEGSELSEQVQEESKEIKKK